MGFKLFGAGMLLLAAAFAAAMLNAGEREKERQAAALLRLLRFFRTQIDCYCVPVGEIFRRCDESILNDCGCTGLPSDFDSFLSSLSPPPEGEVFELLRSFSSRLGTGYREEEVKNCDYHIARLSGLCDELSKSSQAARRKNTVLLMSAAALLAIFLL